VGPACILVSQAAAGESCAHRRYNDVPYHNAVHAADVVSRVCALVNVDGIFPKASLRTKDENVTLLSLILAAAVHDYLHPGTNNAFQVATDSLLSREFNEQHVLENMSAKMALELLRDPQFDFAAAMGGSAKKKLFSNIISLVLATDMSRHYEILHSFKAKARNLSTEFVIMHRSCIQHATVCRLQ